MQVIAQQHTESILQRFPAFARCQLSQTVADLEQIDRGDPYGLGRLPVEPANDKVYSCRKCQSEDLVKDGTNASSSSQYHCNDFPPLEETLQPVECKKIPALEVDELRSFVFRRKDKVWVWIAMNRETREIVASACGDPTENTCRILWDRVPSAYKEAIV